jgi:hypothetical protein
MGRGGFDGTGNDELGEKTASGVICTVSSEDAGTERISGEFTPIVLMART